MQLYLLKNEIEGVSGIDLCQPAKMHNQQQLKAQALLLGYVESSQFNSQLDLVKKMAIKEDAMQASKEDKANEDVTEESAKFVHSLCAGSNSDYSNEIVERFIKFRALDKQCLQVNGESLSDLVFNQLPVRELAFIATYYTLLFLLS
jgi:hypothetical protein